MSTGEELSWSPKSFKLGPCLQALVTPAQTFPEANLELSQAPTKTLPRGGFADVTFWNASSPLCGSTGYRISPHLPPSQSKPWLHGSGHRTQPSKQLLTRPWGWMAMPAGLAGASVLPCAPAGVGRDPVWSAPPGSSSRRGFSATRR